MVWRPCARVPTFHLVVQPPPYRETLPAARARPAGPTEAQIRFRGALQGAMRREWVTDLLVASNVLVLGWMVLAGVSAFFPDVSLVAWGANYGPLTRGGEWWRMVSSMFVHAGIVHLGFNMYALLIAGRLVERLYGHLGYALLYLVAGIAGSAASALTPPEVPSVGASGAVFGVFGALLAFLIRRRALLPPGVLLPLRRSVLTVIAFNVAFGFAVPGIDNAAHLGGLAGGFVAGVLLAPSLDGERIARPFGRYPLLLVLGAGLVWLVGFSGWGG